METHFPPRLRIAEQTPWTSPRSYRPDPIKALRQRVRDQADRRDRIQAIVEWACVALVIATTLYFAVQLMRPHFSSAASAVSTH